MGEYPSREKQRCAKHIKTLQSKTVHNSTAQYISLTDHASRYRLCSWRYNPQYITAKDKTRQHKTLHDITSQHKTSVLYRLLCNRVGGYSCRLNIDLKQKNKTKYNAGQHRTVQNSAILHITSNNNTQNHIKTHNIKPIPMPINGRSTVINISVKYKTKQNTTGHNSTKQIITTR